jgi:8-oxo-dGTP pyrophosphatase MutT (NUDIX family)
MAPDDTNHDGGGMRRSEGAWALITRRFGQEDCWLARWNPRWVRYSFVGGHRHPGETFRDCIVREVCEELNLANGKDYTIAEPEPLTRFVYNAWSRSAGCETRYEMELFGLVLCDRMSNLLTHRPIRWLTRAEVDAMQAADGKQVSETMKHVLELIHWKTLPEKQGR